jgi:hypothetical protein
MRQEFIIGMDYVSFRSGAQIVRSQEKSSIYKINLQRSYQKERLEIGEEVLPFRNPPFTTLIFIPLSNLSYDIGYKLFALFNIFLLMLLFFVFRKRFGLPSIALLILMVFYRPVFETILQGQITIVILLLITVSYLLLKKKLYFSSGFLLSFILMKPSYLLLVPFILLLVPKRKLLYGLVIGSFIFLAVNTFLVGFSALSFYPRFLLMTEESLFGSNLEKFPSIYSFLLYFENTFDVGVYFAPVVLGASYLIVVFYFYRMVGRTTFEVLYSVAIIFALVFSPHLLLHDLVLLLLPIIILAKSAEADKGVFIPLLFLFSASYLAFITKPFVVALLLFVVGVWIINLSKNILPV